MPNGSYSLEEAVAERSIFFRSERLRRKNIARPVRVYRVRPSGAAISTRPSLPLPDKPSIAVLPFQNMSGDPEQEYFADGIVEEIITALVERLSLRAKLGFRVHTHMLRHACGFKMANDGVDTRTIQAYLGHKDIRHTVRYTELSPVRFKGLWKD